MRINRPENLDDEQYKRYLVNISESLLNTIHNQSKNLEYLSYADREHVNEILNPIITSHTVKDNIYKLADASLEIKQIKTPQQKLLKEFADMVYDTHLALHTLNIISQDNSNKIENNSAKNSIVIT